MSEKKLEYGTHWYNYVLKEDPKEIEKIIKEDDIISENKRIHLNIYDNESSGDKTIIFIHGTAVYSRFYAEFCYNLWKKGFRVVAPDLVGHGISEGIRGHFRIKNFCQNIYDVNTYVRDHYGERVGIMGSSLGGVTALYCAAYDPRLKAAICHNAALFNEKAYKKIIKMNLALRILRPLVPLVAKIAPKMKVSVWLYLDFKKLAKTEELLNRIDIFLKDPLLSDKYTATAILTQMRDSPAIPIEEIKTPIMIINGDEDYLFSVEYMEEIFDRLTCEKKRLEIIEGASHLILQENIPEVIERIVTWLNSIL
ncbi:MAG: alpha/beta fold hydrolase [Promethearchaeota archaeon]